MEARIEDTVRDLRDRIDPRVVAPGHCTGWRAMAALAGAALAGQPSVAVMLDVDHFKKVNDTHGHQAGDHVLREIVKRISGQIRTSDVAARYGGEEFAVLMPATRGVEAHKLAERIRNAVSATPMEVTSGQALTVTVSIGIAEIIPPRSATDHTALGEGLLSAADVALYQAKADGRDRVKVAG